MIVPLRIFDESGRFGYPDASGINTAVEPPLKVRGFLPAEAAAEHVRPPRGLLVLQLQREGPRRRQEADFRGARRRGADRVAVAQALRQDPGQDQGQAGSC